ncbi:MAG: HD-GYP domain-containing protein [Acidobacteria bacterium]|nr:HD-GYP domain-containing protein [Acidobacteriota bacterium]
MNDTNRLALYDDLVRRLASAARGSQLYAASHPLIARNIDGLAATLEQLHASQPTVPVGVLDNQIVVSDTPLAKASATMGDLIKRLTGNAIERIAFERGVTRDELVDFIQAVAALGARSEPGKTGPESWSFPHIKVGRISADDRQADGVASDMAAIRRLYADAVGIAERVWDTAQQEGAPDPAVALETVEGLADAVTQNRTALVALTAMRNYDNYTFTHMVNVSILTMGQARALGIEGRLLREFGLSALMHDIGKVRTPKEILNKPDKLTDDEFAIMKRHTVDGAEILRRTPEMPILAPVVAFEHHLRIDRSGYPANVLRPALNLGTMLCSIADVYDAMRSQRAYLQAFPTDRILAVLQRNDGSQFDQHLVRRFVQLIGIYPAGNLVRLSTGEIAVVTKVHAPDPYRPRVRVISTRQGERLDLPVDRNLWESKDLDGADATVAAPLDPVEYGVDPLTFL